MNARKRGEGKTPHRTIRCEDDRWDGFRQAAAQSGSDGTKVLNQFMAWFQHEPGAKLPKRPDITDGRSD